MTLPTTLATVLVLSVAEAVSAFEPALPPGTVETTDTSIPSTQHILPTARFTPTLTPGLRLEGHRRVRTWRVPEDRTDTTALTRALREQVERAGFRILHACASRACGGFDFRFNTHVVPPPDMEVDLANFQYFSAEARTPPPRHLGVLISRGYRGGYVQIVELSAPDPDRLPLATVEPPPVPAGDLSALVETGRAVLEDVRFAPGSSELDPGGLAQVAELARWIGEGELTVVLVGHSDNEGSLAVNIALSRARADAVRSALTGRHGIDPARVSAEGAGFLAPRAPNDSDENRARNRRVEVILR
ncbi:MAG: OmpA family protein [Pseudomonadota bacterium]